MANLWMQLLVSISSSGKVPVIIVFGVWRLLCRFSLDRELGLLTLETYHDIAQATFGIPLDVFSF
ncbi:ATPase-like protein [Sesbania bispinosa]|nr:ATPase-like protein [Sesbania bispinosa]